MNIENILVSPISKAQLPLDEMKRDGKWKSNLEGQEYFYKNGFYELIPNPPPDMDVLDKWGLWEKLQENGSVAYSAYADGNLSVGFNAVEKEFHEFCKLDGTVLDVGCGPQELPSYIGSFRGTVVGIDPLPGSLNRKFNFVRAIGEYLPFKDSSFDRVLFGTSFDHLLSPLRSLTEAKRVLKPGGSICIWYGDMDDHDHDHDHLENEGWAHAISMKFRNALQVIRSGGLKALVRAIGIKLRMIANPGEFKKNLSVPNGAIDHFHFFHVDLKFLRDLLDKAGLKIESIKDSEKERGSHFIRAIPR